MPGNRQPSESVGSGRKQLPYDPYTLMRLRTLELRAKVVVEGFMSGLHRSPYHGFSVEFTDYRQYTPGDDLRYLDWKLLARSDRYYLKRFEDETNLRCHLVVDLSKSMGYGGGGANANGSTPADWSKADYARTLAATLAYFLNGQRDAVGLLTFDQRVVDVIPPRFRPGHLRRLMMALERSAAGRGTDVNMALEQVARTVRKRGLVVLISDLLVPVDQLQQRLGYLRSVGHEVIVLRVLDETEVSFDFPQASLFQDVETGRDLYVDPASARRQYLERFAEHESQVRAACDQLGIEYRRFVTNQPLETALSEFVLARAGRGPDMRRSQNMMAGPNG